MARARQARALTCPFVGEGCGGAGVWQLQELGRAPGGGEQLARFMVRGHWRRPAKNWTGQRLRWIEPCWKGPDLAAVIEKQYRLKA